MFHNVGRQFRVLFVSDIQVAFMPGPRLGANCFPYFKNKGHNIFKRCVLKYCTFKKSIITILPMLGASLART